MLLNTFVFATFLSCCAFGATISVKTFGAAGDGVNDDTAEIQSAVRSSGVSDVIYFPPGTYRISGPIYLTSNRTYQGDGATLKAPGTSFALILPYDSASNITIDGLTLDQGGINVNGSAVPGNNVRITNCTIQNLVSSALDWSERNGIFLPAGIVNSVIAKNRFINIFDRGLLSAFDMNANGIMGWRISNSSITDNVFDSVNQAITLQFNGIGPYPGIVVARNTGTRVHRMGIEMQGARTTGMIVEGNYFGNFLNPWWNTYGLSIVVDGGTDTIIRNNVVDAYPTAPLGTRYGIGIEVGGTRTTVTGNSVRNFWSSIAIGRAPYATVTGNYLCGAFANSVKVTYEIGIPIGVSVSGNTGSATCSSTSSTAPSSPASEPAAPVTPTTSLLSQPAANSILSGRVPLSAQVASGTGIASVRYLLDGSKILAEVGATPYNASFDSTLVADGSHSLQAVVIDTSSVQTASAAVPVQIRNGAVAVTIPQQGLDLWLHAGAGITASGGLVSQWSDLAGTGRVASQGLAARQPLLVNSAVNGLPVVRFADDSMSIPFPINGRTGMTIILVSAAAADHVGGNSKSEAAAIFWDETAWWGTTYLSPFQSNVAFRFGTLQPYNWPQYNRPASLNAAFSLTTAVKNQTVDSLYVNGNLVLSQNTSQSTISGAVNSAILGQGYGDSPFYGDIAEILVYNRALTDSERSVVEGYLLSKYALR